MNFTIGQRFSTRGEDFLVTGTQQNHDESLLIQALGISELVKGKQFVFDTTLDTDIKPLDPNLTQLVKDTDNGYRKTKLFLETQIRNSAIYSQKITIAHKAAINSADYQLTPTLQALQLPRPRILIADAVGLGKTIEVGIFLAELIKRGKGKRIMVLAPKSILAQFQQELWNRFAIPLVRLDSEGIAKIKTQLPLNKNPFDFYDKTIISIDTIKKNAKFRHYLEKSRWDVIVIDECHTVANDKSQKGDLAQFLARQNKSEALVLTSATPHNGKKENFANLINMIEPTAIPRSGIYTKTDVLPYYVRRFKNDILQEDVRSQFRERQTIPIKVALTDVENYFLSHLQHLRMVAFQEYKLGKKEDLLFSIGLLKAYLSSPAAALSTVTNRLEKITTKLARDPLLEENAEQLEMLKNMLTDILQHQADSKYFKFRSALKSFGWSGMPKDNRLVVFAERIDTLNYLRKNLVRDFQLPDDAIVQFHGGLSDTEQQAIVEDFGKEDSRVRLLLCSDAGSQGVNLHYFCHQMFNYDIPWSLITLEQRNGRIDRYGQKEEPEIYYLKIESDNKELKTDLYIIDKLVEKEKEVYNALGDAGSVMGLYDNKMEEQYLIDAIIHGNEQYLETRAASEEEAAAEDNESEDIDYSALYNPLSDSTSATITEDPYETNLSIFRGDDTYYRSLFEQLQSNGQLQPGECTQVDDSYLEIRYTEELSRILYDLPPEAKPEKNGLFKLTLDKALVQKSIEEARKKKGSWAAFQLLYDLHPVVRYYMTKLEASVNKDSALVAKTNILPAATAWFVFQGQVSNNLSQPVLTEFLVVALGLDGRLHRKPLSLKDFIEEFNLTATLYTENMKENEIEQLQSVLPDAVDWAHQRMQEKQQQLEAEMETKMNEYQQKVTGWHSEALMQLELDFSERLVNKFTERIKDTKQREIETILSSSSQYFKNLTSLQGEPFLKVLAVFYNPTKS